VKETPELLEVGRVVKAHGLKGELGVKLHWPQSTALDGMLRIVLQKEQGPVSFEVTAIRPANDVFLVSLQSIADRTAAEHWRGARVLVERSKLPPLAKGEYYLADLVGTRVLTPDGPLGVVVELALYPSVECIVIETPEGERFEQPLVSEWIESVDTSAKEVRLRGRDGLLVP